VRIIIIIIINNNNNNITTDQVSVSGSQWNLGAKSMPGLNYMGEKMRQWAGLSPEIVAVPLVFPICFDQDAPQEGGGRARRR
jgi:hypothetical protein